MALSSFTIWAATEQQIIKEALKKIGQVGDWETFSTSDVRYTDARFALNYCIKALMAIGLPVWKTQDITVAFSNLISGSCTIGPSGATVTSPQPLKIEEAVRRDNTSGIETLMSSVAYNDYLMFPNKTLRSTPTQYTLIPQRNLSTLYVYNAPDTYWATNGSIKLRSQTPVTDMTSATDDIDFPAYWHKAIIYDLACALAPNYGIPLAERVLLEKDKNDLILQASSFDHEDTSVYFQPRRR